MPDIKKIKTPDNVVYDIVDGGISAWARAENKPTYTADEIGLQGAYYVAGSGSTAAKTSSPYYATRWRGLNSAITSLYTGLMINFKIDVAGNGSYGTLLSINDGEQHPVCANVNSMVSTRYAVGCIIPLVYDAAQTATAYINSSSSSTITGCWKIADYDSNTVTQTAVRDFVVGTNSGTLYRYEICLFDEHDGLVPYNNVSNSTGTYTKAVNTASFDPFRGMCWYGTTTAISAGNGVAIGSNSMYLVYQQDARYSFNLNSGVSSSSVAAGNGATVFNTSYKYAVGSYCTYAGELYKCKTAITTAGAWDASQWTKISFYNSTATYAVNDECIHSGYVWKCTTAIGSGGEAWNAAHWTYATMTGMISSYPVYIKAKYNKTTHLATFQQDTTSTSYLVRSGITQGLPEEDPNTGLGANEIYIYIFIGRSYTCYNIGMFAEHPVYYWNEIARKATIFTGAEEAVVPTKTSDLINDGDDGSHPFLATNDVATVATTGSYNDLTNKPTIPSAPGTLNTTATTAQSTAASEALSGSITLHKIAKTGTYSDLIGLPTLGTAAAKNTTNTYSATGTDPITGTGVAAALATLPTPMQFKGTVGSSGTIEWSALPTAAASNTGYVYKVISDHATAPVCKTGDTIVSNGSSWIVIPSGDEPAGTVTNVAISNGGGLSVSGSPITSSGTITISHSDTSSQASVSNSGRTYIQSVTLDTYGHVTGLSSATETVTDTNTTYALSGALSSHKFTSTLTAGGSGSGTSTTDLTLAAGSNITLTDDTTNRKITIAATDTNTTYTLNVSGTGDNATKVGLVAGGSGSGTTWYTIPYATSAGAAPASDVYAWAKAATKPTYTASEVGALPSNTTYVSSVNGASGAVTGIQTTSNLTTTISSSSTDTQYPSALAVYTALQTASSDAAIFRKWTA